MSLPSRELSEAGLDALIARERTRVVAPLTEWHTLAAQLRDEGLVHGVGRTPPASTYTGVPVAPRPAGPWRGAMRWTRNAAVGAALVGGGVVIGRGMTLGDQIAPMIRSAITKHDTASVAVRLDSNGTSVVVTSHGFNSPTAAKAVLARSQADYQRAAAYLAATDTVAPTATSPAVYRARLSALDEMMAATFAALQRSPTDPLLNQYYLSAVGARDATLRELQHAPPPGAKLVRF